MFLRDCVEKRKTKSSLDEETVEANNDGNECNVTIEDDVDGDLTELPIEQTSKLDSQTVNQPSSVPQTPQPSPQLKPMETFTVRPPSVTSRKRTMDQVAATELKVLQDISKRMTSRSTEVQRTTATEKCEGDQDQDRMFLLSLLNDVKKVHEDNKLELKSEMMLLIKKWQKATPNRDQFNNQSFQLDSQHSNFNQPYNYQLPGQSGQRFQRQPSSAHSKRPEHNQTQDSPSLLDISNMQSPEFNESTVDSPFSSCSEFYK